MKTTRKQKTLTADQIAKRDARQAKFKNLVAKLAERTDDERADWAASNDVRSIDNAKRFSTNNTCLILEQCETASIVGGFRQWLDAGRCVRKGETGLMIWFPVAPKSENQDPTPSDFADVANADEKSKPRFRIGTVFDISQTVELTNETAEATETAAA